MMKYSLPTFTVYVPRKAGEAFLVQRYMENAQFGFSQATGDPIELHESDLIERGGALAEQLLMEYPTQTGLGMSSLDRMPGPAKRRFVRAHFEVSIVLTPTGQVKVNVVDLDPSGDSGVGRDAEAELLSRPVDGARLLAALRSVTEKAAVCEKNQRGADGAGSL